MFALNFDDLSDAIIKVEGNHKTIMKNVYSQNGIPDVYTSLFILDENLKGDEKIELITNEHHFILEGNLER